MIEVTAKLEFITPCLGASRDSTQVWKFLRDTATGGVILPQAVWRGILDYGAKAISRHQSLVEDIQCDPIVEGSVTVYRRHYVIEHDTQ